jgi:hypothetical protein
MLCNPFVAEGFSPQTLVCEPTHVLELDLKLVVVLARDILEVLLEYRHKAKVLLEDYVT